VSGKGLHQSWKKPISVAHGKLAFTAPLITISPVQILRIFLLTVVSTSVLLIYAGGDPVPSGKIILCGIIAPPMGEEILDTPETSSGKSRVTQSTNLVFLSVTNRIPAVMDIRFAFAFSITNIPAANGQTKLTKIVRHPKMFKPDGTVSEGFTFQQPVFIQNGGAVTDTGYGFDHPYELVPGIWDFTMKYQGTTLCTQRFLVYKPDPAGK
jgi:hypothetical protein